MTSVPRPKPWEQQRPQTEVPAPVLPPASSTASAASPAATSTATMSAPALPSRPSQLQPPVVPSYSNYGSYRQPYTSQPYSSFSPYNSYPSPYSRMYGGNNVLGQQPYMESSTTAAFQMLEAVVGAFGGFAQMLESTYMATHSSFFAMVGVAEQITALRKNVVASASVGVLALWRVFVRIWRRLTGRPAAVDTGVNLSEFERFRAAASDVPKVSMWPLVVFLAAVFGGPYLMTKLIKSLASKQEPELRFGGPDAAMLADETDESVIDPAKLEFCRALYDFVPESESELGFSKGEIIAILAKDESAAPAWWKGRLRSGRTGYFPSNYVDVIRRKAV